MAHFAFISPPFASHLRALEALAQALMVRGHRASWIAPVDVLDQLVDRRIGRVVVGAQALPAGSLTAVVERAARPGGYLGLRRVIADMSMATGIFCREGRQALQAISADSVIADQMEAAGGLLAASLDLQCTSVACALPINREPCIPLPVMPWGFATDARALNRNAVSERVHDWLMRPHFEAIRRGAAALGLAGRASLLDCLSPTLQLSQTTAGFDFPRTRLPRHFHHLGPLRPPLSEELPLDLPLRADRPFVFASLGTLQGGRFGLFKRIAQACRQLDAQLLIAHCGRLDAAQCRALEAAGASWVTDFAPQRAALARADVVVSHAGLNTVLDALVAGTPMLALPIAFDQNGAAARVVHAGAGLRLMPAFATTAAIRRHLQRLLAEPGFGQRASVLGAEVASAGGTRLAADLIERALGVTPPRELAHAN